MPTADGDIVDLLAESWTSTETLDTWRFKVRASIPFHVEDPLTAETVTANLTKFREESSLSTAPVTDKSFEGDEVVVTLDRAYSKLPAIVVDWNTCIISATSLKNEASGSVASTVSFTVTDASDATMLKRRPMQTIGARKPQSRTLRICLFLTHKQDKRWPKLARLSSRLVCP